MVTKNVDQKGTRNKISTSNANCGRMHKAF